MAPVTQAPRLVDSPPGPIAGKGSNPATAATVFVVKPITVAPRTVVPTLVGDAAAVAGALSVPPSSLVASSIAPGASLVATAAIALDAGQGESFYSDQLEGASWSDVIVQPDPITGTLGVGDIQAALTGLRGPGRVRLPSGEFFLDQALQLGDGQQLFGNGAEATRLITRSAVGILATGATGVTLADLTLEGSAGNTGLRLQDVEQVTIRNVAFRHMDTGIDATSAPTLGTGSASISLLRLEHCRFVDCRRIGVDLGSNARETKVVACTFTCRDQAIALRFFGEGLLATGNRFLVTGMGARGSTPLVQLAGRPAALRYNVFAGSTPHLLLEAGLRGGPWLDGRRPAQVLEHNVHLADQQQVGLPLDGDPVLARPGAGALVRGGSSVGPRTAESCWNLLVNGSFEWSGPSGSATIPGWETEPIGGQGWSVATVRTVQGAGDSIDDVQIPAGRDGHSAARVAVPHGSSGELRLRGSLTCATGRGRGTDAWLTFSCWVRLERDLPDHFTSLSQAEAELLPEVSLELTTPDGRGASVPYQRELAGTWQVLSCCAPGLPNQTGIAPRIVVRRQAAPGTDSPAAGVVLDGAQLQAGLLVTSSATTVIGDDGGQIFGDLRLGRTGEERTLPLLQRLEIPDGESVELLPVPPEIHGRCLLQRINLGIGARSIWCKIAKVEGGESQTVVMTSELDAGHGMFSLVVPDSAAPGIALAASSFLRLELIRSARTGAGPVSVELRWLVPMAPAVSP